MAVEQPQLIDTSAVTGHLEDLYAVCLELVILTKVWEELSVGPRNANDASALDRVNARLRALRHERAQLHKAIHELPQKRAVTSE